jgi:16S rRNA (adenine1518-N6/adenine1519-N6)-dimethyltransferase
VGARREARRALESAGLRPHKRWGQHFLCDPSVVERIVAVAAIDGGAVLEIGPGLGALTDALRTRASRLYLVEIDRGLAARLEARYAAHAHVRVLEGDILELPLRDLIAEPRVTVVANLPYGITTPILFRLLELRARFPRAVVMMQREVAQRLVATPGSAAWGVLPAIVQAFATARLAFGVSRRSFVPVPRVESAVVDLRWSDEPRVPIGDGVLYRAVVRAAFGQRRKMLRNALGELATAHGHLIDGVLEAAGIDPRARAETLALTDFARLTQAIER